MFSWLQKDVPIAASALFRGTWPCNKAGFCGLKERGIEIKEVPAGDGAMWALELTHPEWGEATLLCLREFPMPPHLLVDWDADLIDSERDEIKACGNAVNLMVNSRRKHLLRDRKNALLFLEAIMGEEGVAALDHVSQKFWSRTALKCEAAHTADADAMSLFTVHYVAAENDGGYWLHTHGLSSIGFVDFDILNPCEAVATHGSEAVRAVAEAIIEGNLKPGGELMLFGGRESIRAIPASEFMEKAAPKWRAIREADEDHNSDRVVLCDPAGKGLFSKWRSEVSPSSVLSKELPDDTLIHFSTESTQLMSARAKKTYPLLRDLIKELEKYEPPALVKIGYQVDGGTEHEHLWFQVNEARENEVEATLLNQPFHIARMKEGDRGTHSVKDLSDWQIMTPAGPINPRQTLALRFLREVIAKGGEEQAS